MLYEVADPVTTEVIRNFMTSCAEDMNATLFRSAYSPVIYEGRDCVVALLDANGDPLGMSTGVPIFLGNLEVCVKYTVERFGPEWVQRGDVVAMNDPYVQGTHLHDVTVFGPIFYLDQLVGFAATRAHWRDVGGRDPATTMASTDIYQEGFRLGPTRVVRGYEPQQEWMDYLRHAGRFGHELIGDLNAQIAAIRTGERRFVEMLDRVGVEVFEAAKQRIFRQAEELDRAAVMALPDGVYKASGVLDNDGQGSDPIPVVVSIEIKGDRMMVDLAGSAPQAKGCINCGYSQAVSAVRLAYKAVINTDHPVTGGSFATLEVKVPDDCIFNAREPAPCEWYGTGLGLLADLILQALAPVIGDRAVAAHYGHSMIIAFHGDTGRRGRLWAAVEPTPGGWGGHSAADGESGLINLGNGGYRNTSIEVYETKYPVRFGQFSRRPDSGGAGKHRGGCGVIRSYTLEQPAELSLWFERSLTPAWGIFGGEAGSGPDVTIRTPQSEWKALKTNGTPLPAGSTVTLMTGGGGGFGDPRQRLVEEVLRDVREGYVSIGAAREQYGVVLDELTGALDEAATAALREVS